MMEYENKYPHFIPDRPQGEDAFDGKSQKRLASTICDYIRLIDKKPEKEEENNDKIPRIIGIEGGWGSGKSNVVRMIKENLEEEGYYLFIYDAWGHQEDLQRRSILETLTKDLITNDVLTGKVSIETRTGEKFTDTWRNQLQMLLSNKTIIKSHSIPTLSCAGMWAIVITFVYSFCFAVANKVIGACFLLKYNWWIYGIPAALAFCVLIGYLIKDGSFKNALKIINKNEEDTTTFQYTSSEEPSVSEFRSWMQTISDDLGKKKCFESKKYRKLIIVFDNMDRLPSEKVMQLWSSIYTFFADGEYENIWTIIPYDYIHLCQAIFGKTDEDDDKRIKHFISKTFPITYIVPPPVITDYKNLFYTYFDKAFGKEEHDREHICQVFMHLKRNPNPRTVITFVNELVALRMQWPDTRKYRLQNLALYVLKKDYLFYNDGADNKNTSLESKLLSDGWKRDIFHFYPDQDGNIRRQICQFAYGLEDEKLAGELPLRLKLGELLHNGESIKDYVSQPNFVTVLEYVLSDINVVDLDKIVNSMLSLDEIDLSEEQKSSIRHKWDMLTNYKADSLHKLYNKPEYDSTIDSLIRHSTEKRIEDLTRSFCYAASYYTIENGDAYFDSFHKLKSALESISSKLNLFDYIESKTTNPLRFVEFLNSAGEEYKNYKLSVDNTELNDYLLKSTIDGLETSAITVDRLMYDKDYNFTFLKENLVKEIEADKIENDIRPAAYINRILDTNIEIVKARFSSRRVEEFLNSLPALRNDKNRLGTEDVLAMYFADGKDVVIEFLDDIDMLSRISDCIEKYMDSAAMLTRDFSKNSAYKKLLVYMIKNKKGRHLDTSFFARNTSKIKAKLGLDSKTLFDYANKWKCEEIKDLTTNVRQYLDINLFRDYLTNKGNFTDGLIRQGIKVLEEQHEGFLRRPRIQFQSNDSNYACYSYWKHFVMTFVGTEFMNKLNKQLTKELVLMLNQIIETNGGVDQDLLEFMLKQEPDADMMKEYLNEAINEHFTKDDITIIQFKVFGPLLPKFISDVETNTARNLALYFIKPVYTDKDCAQIIVKYKDFYLGLLMKDTSAVQEVLKGMMDNAETSDVYDIIKEGINRIHIVEEGNDY